MNGVSVLREWREKTGKTDPFKGLYVVSKPKQELPIPHRSKSRSQQLMALHRAAVPTLEPNDDDLSVIIDTRLVGVGELSRARKVAAAVAKAEGLTYEQLTTRGNIRSLTRLRKEVCFIARWLDCSYHTIAAALGYDNHTTVIHHVGRRCGARYK